MLHPFSSTFPHGTPRRVAPTTPLSTTCTHLRPPAHLHSLRVHTPSRTRPLTSKTLTTPLSTACSHLKPLAHLHSPRVHAHSVLMSPHVHVTSLPGRHVSSRKVYECFSHSRHLPRTHPRPPVHLDSACVRTSSRPITYVFPRVPRFQVDTSPHVGSTSVSRTLESSCTSPRLRVRPRIPGHFWSF